VALTAAGCGGSTNPADGGTGGKTDGGTGGKGTGGTGTGGAGTGGTGTGGARTGGAGGANTGGANTGGANTGGSNTGGAQTGGAPATGGAGGAAGGAGGTNPCMETPVCTLNARTCTAGVPQLCMANSLGCPGWVAQAACGAHQTCTAATGMCTCNAEARCGTPGAEGHFCPTVGGASFSVCTKDANNCFFVSAENQACTAPQTCQGAGVVPVGMACGCPANGTTLNSGCANQAVNATIASATDNAVLRCEMVGACKIWRILVNCADQSLTAGTDTATNMPACVCKPAGAAPGSANTLYVDPDPPMATFMTNSPTGAIQPPACRIRRLRDAIAATTTTFTRVVAIHETSSDVHFTKEFKNLATNANTSTPLTIPAGVEVTTADGPSFNPAHYTVDLFGGDEARVVLSNGSSLSGFTLSAIDSVAYGTPSVLTASDILGCTAGASTAHHLAIVGRTASQTAIAVNGNCALTGNLIAISNVDRGVEIDYTATSGATTASFTGTTVTINAASRGVEIADGNSSATLTSSAITLAGVGGAIGVNVGGGTATLNQTAIALTANVDAASSAIRSATVATAAPTVTVTGGTITTASASAASANAVDIVNGTATLAGASVTVGGNTRGVRAQNASHVTINGASVLTTSCKVGTSDCDATIADPDTTGPLAAVIGSDTGSGVFVPAGVANTDVVLTIGGTTAITGYLNGIETNDGSLAIAGTVNVSGNTNDGLALLGTNVTATTVVNVAGATIENNGRDGINVNSTLPVTVGTTTIRRNSRNGINVLGSQNTAQAGYKFLLQGGTVSGNWARGVFLAQETLKVGARIENATISGNGLEGVRISDSLTGATFTEVLMEGNTISGNLSRSATADVDIIAGGVFFANSGVNGPTRVVLGAFIGNSVFANGRHEIGFDIAQNGFPSPAWDLSSTSPAVDQAMVCSATAKPNKVYCYDTIPGSDLGVAVSSTMIAVKIKGMSFQNLPPTGGRDFSAGIAEPTVLTPEPTAGIFLSCAATACPAM